MATKDRTRLALPAEIALAALRPEERNDVLTALDRLQAEPLGAVGLEAANGGPARSGVSELEGSPRLFVLRVGDRLRVVFSREDDGAVLVQDILSQGMIEHYRAAG